MRIHRPQSEIIVGCLRDIFEKKFLADKVVQFQLKSQRQMGARDRRWVAETVYEIVRWWRLIRFWCQQLRAAQDNPWLWLGVYLIWRGFELPKWREFEPLLGLAAKDLQTSQSLSRAIRESIPDWLDQLGETSFGTQWDFILRALNQPAEVVLRVNQLKTTASELIPALQAEGIEVSPIDEMALKLINRKNLFSSSAYQAGLFEIQDWSSQQVALFLNPQPGERVVDACAGAGGKTLHLAALMQNKGRIVAMDVDEKKLMELKRRQRRAGVDIIETRWIQSNKTIKRLAESADRVLLDVPCSGLGVLRRKPDTKWKLSYQKILELIEIQKKILNSHSEMVKPRGVLVYSTCSILKLENQEVVRNFLDSHEKNFFLEEEKLILPNESGFDGFYMARLRRT